MLPWYRKRNVFLYCGYNAISRRHSVNRISLWNHTPINITLQWCYVIFGFHKNCVMSNNHNWYYGQIFNLNQICWKAKDSDMNQFCWEPPLRPCWEHHRRCRKHRTFVGTKTPTVESTKIFVRSITSFVTPFVDKATKATDPNRKQN